MGDSTHECLCRADSISPKVRVPRHFSVLSYPFQSLLPLLPSPLPTSQIRTGHTGQKLTKVHSKDVVLCRPQLIFKGLLDCPSPTHGQPSPCLPLEAGVV